MKTFAELSILLVEDEYLIALEAEQMLEIMGIKSVEIASTWEIAAMQAEEGRFDIALLDVNLNGRLSFPIADKLAQRGIPVVFASGYDLRHRIDTDFDFVCVTKPYTAEVLKKALATALAKETDSK